MLEPTHEEVTRAIEHVVRGGSFEFVYQRPDEHCWYVWDKKPSCLVGQVLHRLGVGIEQLSDVEQSSVRVASRLLRFRRIIDLPEKSVRGLVAAQIVQDGGNTWGQALQAFYEQSK